MNGGKRLTKDVIKKHSSGAAFVKYVRDEVFASTAINHPYLQAISKGDFPNLEFALKDFAYQYGLYSAKFSCYLSAVIENLSNIEHKQILQLNLAEENGDTHDVDLPSEVVSSIANQSHVQLYQRFEEALGVDDEFRKVVVENQAGFLWGQQFLQLCEKNEYVGVGAIGIGTELIVSNIYNQVLDGLKAHTSLTVLQRIFFDLHSKCDDEHADQLLKIAEDLANNNESCEQIAYGAQMAISLRTEFWDRMLDRALNYQTHTLSTTEALPEIGYQTSI